MSKQWLSNLRTLLPKCKKPLLLMAFMLHVTNMLNKTTSYYYYTVNIEYNNL